MATTSNTITATAGQIEFPFSFPYLKKESIKVTIDTVATTAFTIPDNNPTTVVLNSGATAGQVIVISRLTSTTATPSTFFSGGAIRSQDLNNNFDSILYITQEKENQLTEVIAGGIADGSITSSKLANQSVGTAALIDGGVATVDLADNAVTSAKIADGTILNINVNTAAAIDGTKISPNFGAQNIITTGSVGGSTATFSGDVLQYTTLKTPYYLREPDFDAPTLTTQKSYNIPTWANRFVVNMDNGAVTGSNVVLLVQFGSATAWWNHTSTFVSNPSSAISVASWIAAQSPFATGSAVTTDGFALGLVGVAGYYSSSHTVFMKMLDRWSNSGTFQYEPTSNPTLTGRGTGKIFTNPVDFINTPTQIRIVGSAGGPIAGKFGVTWFSE